MSDVAKVNLQVNKGATFRHKFTWQNARSKPINLTGYLARMHIRAEVNSADVIIALTTENGGITLGGVLGTISLYISNTATSSLTAVKGVYDLELVAPNNDVIRLIAGAVAMSPEVTR